MANHGAPNDPKKFTMIAFIAFVVVFVFTMLIMLWHGNVYHNDNGARHYHTRVMEP